MPPKGKISKSSKDSTKEFHKLFSEIYGARWKSLCYSLAQPTQHIALKNNFICSDAQLVDGNDFQKLFTFQNISCYSQNKWLTSYPAPSREAVSCLRTHYWMDLASLLPVLLLDVRPGMAVLDMCAAPGGKSFALAQQLWADMSSDASAPPSVSSPQPITLHASQGRLVCNEPDRQRVLRLNNVIEEHVPGATRLQVDIKNYRGELYWQRNQRNTFDRVLVDAPCSSERHVVQQAAAAVFSDGLTGGAASVTKALMDTKGAVSSKMWSMTECLETAALQFQLCLAAVTALKPGGRLVYSTCSIVPDENDEVIRKLLKRVGVKVDVLPAKEVASEISKGRGEGSEVAGEKMSLYDIFKFEETEYGIICLPDGPAGAGIIYAAVIQKREDAESKTGKGGVVEDPDEAERRKEEEMKEMERKLKEIQLPPMEDEYYAVGEEEEEEGIEGAEKEVP